MSHSLTKVCADDGGALRIMVCAWTNIAIDRILLGLKKRGEDSFLRVGSVRKMAKELLGEQRKSILIKGLGFRV